MERLMQELENFQNETEEVQKRAVAGALNIIKQLVDEQQQLKEHLEKMNRDQRRTTIGRTKTIVKNYIDLIELRYLTEDIVNTETTID